MARKTWENLRDTFRRKFKDYRKTKSGTEATPSEKWPYFGSMMFLKDVMIPRGSSGNLSATLEESDASPHGESIPVEDVNAIETDVNECLTQPATSASFVTPQNQERKRHLRKKIDYDMKALDIEKRKIELLEEHVSRKKHRYEGDEDYSFLMSLLPTMKQLNQLEKMKLRMKILGNVTEALEEHNLSNRMRPSGTMLSPTGSHFSYSESSHSPAESDSSQHPVSFSSFIQMAHPILQTVEQPGQLELDINSYAVEDI